MTYTEHNITTCYLPENRGHKFFHSVIGPREAYCPRANSIKNSGSPAKLRVNTYGMRNAPAV